MPALGLAESLRGQQIQVLEGATAAG